VDDTKQKMFLVLKEFMQFAKSNLTKLSFICLFQIDFWTVLSSSINLALPPSIHPPIYQNKHCVQITVFIFNFWTPVRNLPLKFFNLSKILKFFLIIFIFMIIILSTLTVSCQCNFNISLGTYRAYQFLALDKSHQNPTFVCSTWKWS
jgi:hypothetical protein